MRLFLSLVLALISSPMVWAQDPVTPLSGVVLLDARDEHSSCITTPAASLSETVCQSSNALRVGKAVRLLVLHRRFLTDYALEVGEPSAAKVSEIPVAVIQAIKLPGEPGPTVLPRPSIERKNSLDLLQELADATSSSEPLAELEREDRSLGATERRIQAEIYSFQSRYDLLVGDETGTDCDLKKVNERQRDGFSIKRCLSAAVVLAHALITAPQPDASLIAEQQFRGVVGDADGLFTDVRNLGDELRMAGFDSEGRRIESEIDSYEEDAYAFRANLEAAKGAIRILKQFQGRDAKPVFSLQLRELLRSRFANSASGSGTSKPTLDDAELNALVDQYLNLLKSSQSIPQLWRQSLETFCNLNQTTHNPDAFLVNRNEIQTKIDVQLPTLISSINVLQERLALELNEQYELSNVPVSESDFGLGAFPANGVVTYRIVRTNGFEPYLLGQTGSTPVRSGAVEVSAGAFGITLVTPPPPEARKPRTIWQILRLTH